MAASNALAVSSGRLAMSCRVRVVDPPRVTQAMLAVDVLGPGFLNQA
jgi:hypothetical protein